MNGDSASADYICTLCIGPLEQNKNKPFYSKSLPSNSQIYLWVGYLQTTICVVDLKTRIYVLYIATFTILSIYTKKKQIVLSKNLLHHNDIFLFMIYLYIVYCDNASAL